MANCTFAPVKAGVELVLPYKRQGASHENIFRASIEAEACSHMRQRVVHRMFINRAVNTAAAMTKGYYMR